MTKLYVICIIKMEFENKSNLDILEQCGGQDILDLDNYEEFENKRYCDKGGHRLRSLENNPNHNKHWKTFKEP